MQISKTEAAIVSHLIDQEMKNLSQKEELNEVEALESEEIYKLNNRILLGDVTKEDENSALEPSSKLNVSGLGDVKVTINGGEVHPRKAKLDLFEQLLYTAVSYFYKIQNYEDVMDAEITTMSEEDAIVVSAYSYPMKDAMISTKYDVYETFDIDFAIVDGKPMVRTTTNPTPMDLLEFQKNDYHYIWSGIEQEFRGID